MSESVGQYELTQILKKISRLLKFETNRSLCEEWTIDLHIASRNSLSQSSPKVSTESHLKAFWACFLPLTKPLCNW
jgi:hypothetical protein